MLNQKKRKKTETSSFGSSKRESHDSSRFYNSKLYNNQQRESLSRHKINPFPSKYENYIFVKSAEKMEEIPNNSIHLVVSSPPYNVGKDYDKDFSLEEYLIFLNRVWIEVKRVLISGGRVCLNIANIGRKPYIPLHSHIITNMEKLGFLMRGEIIWDKSASAGTSTAWGSWQSASNPTLRDVHEYILIFSKDVYKRDKTGKISDTITREEFLVNTKSVWSFPTESAKRIGHPAPFPLELPYRLIQLYSFKDDIILDPFMGSGQTAIAALKAFRRFVGYDINPKYVDLADRRIRQFKEEQSRKSLDNFLFSSKDVKK